MKTTVILLLLLILFFTTQINGQVGIYKFDTYFLSIDSITVKAYSPDSSLFYIKYFYSIENNFVDLDSDGVNELLIIDKKLNRDNTFFTIYVYNTIDTFYLADSIYSGRFEPYQVFSEDIGSLVIAAGMPDFDSLMTTDTTFSLPLNFWKYEDDALFIANASIYDLFIIQNEELIDRIENYLKTNDENCDSSEKLKTIIASTYVNYLSAGEKSVAAKFLKKYYLCNDLEKFRDRLFRMFSNQ